MSTTLKWKLNGGLKDIDLDAIISEVERDGYTVKQISTCYSDKQFQAKKIMMPLFISFYLLRNLNISSALDNH